MKNLMVICPDQIQKQLEAFVKDGWAENIDEAVVEALRRFLDSHNSDLVKSQVLADVEWGLHGRD